MEAAFVEISGILGVYFSYLFFALAHECLFNAGRLRFEQGAFLFSKLAERIIEQDGRYLLTAQIGRFLSGAVILFTLFWEFRKNLEFTSGVEQLYQFALVFVGMLVLTVFTFLLLQAIRALLGPNVERSLAYMSPLLIMFGWILFPLTWLTEYFAQRLSALTGLKMEVHKKHAVSADEISEIVERSSEAGKIEENESEMIQSVFQFSEKSACEAMTPRKDIVWVDETVSLQELVEVFTRQGFSRVIVAGKDLDEVKGIVIVKDLISRLAENRAEFSIKEVLRPPYFVPGDKKLDELLHEFRSRGVHIAVVLDEHGGVDGLITVEDLVEELVGEIFDEYDVPGEDLKVRKIGKNDFVVDGSVSIEELNNDFGFKIPEGEYDTLAGFVLHLLGNIPVEGQMIEHGSYRIRVDKLEQNRIVRLRIFGRQSVESFSSQNVSKVGAPVLAKQATN